MNRPLVLVVDDQAVNVALMRAFLEEVDCDVASVASGAEVLDQVDRQVPDMILLDVNLPGLSGLEVCRLLKARPATRLVPVVIVTALNATADRIHALESGADDFLSKPVDRAELVARVRASLRLKSVLDSLEGAEQVIFALARTVEAKDLYTRAHTDRVADNSRVLGERLGLMHEQLDALYKGGLIHDIGKVGVPESILGKPGPLDPQEMELMRRHTLIGEEIVRPLRTAAALLPIIRHHHERFDGTGYPDGLRGVDIPIEASIVAVCDAFDAMTTDRPYRQALTEEKAITVLQDGAARQWDGQIVAAFISQLREDR